MSKRLQSWLKETDVDCRTNCSVFVVSMFCWPIRSPRPPPSATPRLYNTITPLSADESHMKCCRCFCRPAWKWASPCFPQQKANGISPLDFKLQHYGEQTFRINLCLVQQDNLHKHDFYYGWGINATLGFNELHHGCMTQRHHHWASYDAILYYTMLWFGIVFKSVSINTVRHQRRTNKWTSFNVWHNYV